jgi:hypothetical protein
LTTTGKTQTQAVKRKYADLQQSVDAYAELFQLMRTGSGCEAAEILARIRSGSSVEAILRHVRDADLLLQLHIVPEVRHQYSFPYSKEFQKLLTQA